jgi:hypothetical protein
MLGLFSLLATTAVLLPHADGPTREPKYKGKPTYGVLSFDAEGKQRIWMVRDGDTLYVDRNGNGDLTDPGEAIVLDTTKTPNPEFDVGDIHLDKRIHKGLTVAVGKLAQHAGPLAERADIALLLSLNPDAPVYSVRCEVQRPDLKGTATDGRVVMVAGFLDLEGPLQFSPKADLAPQVVLGGPLEITFFQELPRLKTHRSAEMVLVVGSPGAGPGTLAMLVYDGVIPEDVHPTAELTFRSARAGQPPFKRLFELKQRC